MCGRQQRGRRLEIAKVCVSKRQRRWAPQITVDEACEQLEKYVGHSWVLIGLTGNKAYQF